MVRSHLSIFTGTSTNRETNTKMAGATSCGTVMRCDEEMN